MARSPLDRTRLRPATARGSRGLGALLATGALAFLAARSSTAPAPQHAERQRILMFDVNGTLLEIEAMAPLFRRVFGDGQVLREWFAQTLLMSQSLTLSGRYAEFGALGGSVLQMLGDARGARVTRADKEELKARTQSLPPYPEVPAALRRLRRAGFRLVTLSNGASKATAAQLRHAGLDELFEQSFSVDAVGRYKPALETYRYAARQLRARLAELRLVAAHTWDVTGALEAGCAAALVMRSSAAPLSLSHLKQPDIVGHDLAMVADQIIEQDR